MDRKSKTVALGSSTHEFLTVAGLAGVLRYKTKNGGLKARSRDALLKLIDRGIMPDANFRDAQDGRLYSKDVLVPALREIFKGIGQGKAITIAQRQEILQAFDDERKFFEPLMR